MKKNYGKTYEKTYGMKKIIILKLKTFLKKIKYFF